MTTPQAPNVGIYYGWALGESGWNTQMDSNLKTMDALLMIGVLSASTVAPPGSPSSADRYLIPVGATGVWATYDGSIAIWNGTAWEIFPTKSTWTLIALDTGQRWVNNAGTWVLSSSLLGQYVDDAAAATGSVPVGGLYVNSSTGAITARQLD